MNKRIRNFFEKDLVLKIISILIGILIWFIVLDQQNPLIERKVSIPLRSNREVLANSSISLVSSNIPGTVDVLIRGRKQRLDKISPNDFNAFLDFSVVEDTETTEIPIDIPEYIGDQDIIVLDVNPKVVKIKLENIVRKEFPISIKWIGEFPEGYEAVDVKTNPNTIIMQELESVMNSISSVAVTVDREKLLEGNSINKRIEVYNEEGKMISASDANIQVNISYRLSKSVPITTTITGKPMDDYYIKDYTLSQNTVRILGDYNIIKDVTEIKAEQLDVSNVNSSFQKELQLQLPENVELYKSDNVITAQVNIEQFTHKMISIPNSSVTIFGGDVTGKVMYSILEDEIAFSVKGPGEILDTIDLKAIKGFADVSELEEGTSMLEIQLSLPSGVYIDEAVYITVEVENVVLPTTPEPTDETDEPAPAVKPEPSPEVPFEKENDTIPSDD
jgi:YbbR domain-containing protein